MTIKFPINSIAAQQFETAQHKSVLQLLEKNSQVYSYLLSFGEKILTFISLRSKQLLLICTYAHTQASSPLRSFSKHEHHIFLMLFMGARGGILKILFSLSVEHIDLTQTFVLEVQRTNIYLIVSLYLLIIRVILSYYKWS